MSAGRWIIALSLLVGTAGCSDDFSISFTEEGVGFATELSPGRIELVEGAIVAFRVRPYENDDALDEEAVLNLASDDPDVLGVAPVARAFASPEEHHYVLWGAGPGVTTLRVVVDFDTRMQIPARIVGRD